MSADEYRLAQPPSDSISSLAFQNNELLLVASWDRQVRLYHVGSNTLMKSYQEESAVLAATFVGGSRSVSGTTDGALSSYDLNSQTKTSIGNHEAGVRCVSVCNEVGNGTVFSGSWDRTVKLWDDRQGAQNTAVTSIDQPDKVYTMDTVGTKLVVGTAGRHVWIWDVRNMERPLQRRESNLKFQTRSLACFPSGEGYAMGSIEGRVAVEYFAADAQTQQNKFAFKCHRDRRKEPDCPQEVIYPVNAIAFHPVSGNFATGGSDGIINMWDPRRRKRLYQMRPTFDGVHSKADGQMRYETGVSALAFAPDGSRVCIGMSYQYESGDVPAPNPALIIRTPPDYQK